MLNENQGPELNQLARLLFDKAARGWYWSMFFEIMAGLVGPVVSLVTLPISHEVFCSIMGLLIFTVAWFLKFKSTGVYERAETMRRQALFTEALDWPISAVQFSHWRDMAGKRIIDALKANKRSKDYYDTKKEHSAEKLLDMAAESAFWTRHLYSRLQSWLFCILLAGVIATACVIMFVPLLLGAEDIKLKAINFVYLFLPVTLSIDIWGWWLKVKELVRSIKEIEQDFENLRVEVIESQVLRLVSEYNCQVVRGIPIPNWFYKLYWDEITELWKLNKKMK